MTFLNPRFRDPGASPGQAAHWTHRTRCQAHALAALGANQRTAVEDFDWNKLALEFEDGSEVRAFFGRTPSASEHFADGWLVIPFIRELSPALVEQALFADLPRERWSTGWLDFPYATSYDAVPSVAAKFDGLASEGFDWSLASPSAFTATRFNGGTSDVERFDQNWPPMKSF